MQLYALNVFNECDFFRLTTINNDDRKFITAELLEREQASLATA